jgi:2Fe-2S ferredoxin
MVHVKFVQWNGDEQTAEGSVGLSLMETALNNCVPGIVADCGGNCSCGTCRVFVDPTWYAKVGEPNELEAEMLEMHAEQRENQRLSCQLVLTEELDGLTVSLPRSQF